jgi:hypothetical protein
MKAQSKLALASVADVTIGGAESISKPNRGAFGGVGVQN